MLESRVEKKNFITCFLLLLGAVLLLTVYPLRLYKEDHVFQTGETVSESSALVYDKKDTGATFVAEYSHLQTLSVYITEMPWQGDLFCNVYDLSDPVMPKNLTKEAMTVTEDMVPGYATFIMDLDLEPGTEYTYIITGGGTYGGVFRMGFVNDAENTGDALPHLIHSIYHDSAVQGKNLISRYTYRMPIEKKPSFLLMGVYALVTLAVIFLVRALFGKGKILQGTWSLKEGMRYTLSPVILLSGGLLLYLIVIRQLFDHRIADITAFAVGTILTMAVLLFGLFRKALPHEKEMDGKLMLVVLPEWLKNHGMQILFSVFFALAFHCTTEYMNGASNLAHYIAEEKMLLFLALAFACTLRRGDVLNRYVLIWIVQSLPYGIYYYLTHRFTPDMKEFEENNLLLRLLIYITVVTGVVLIAVTRRWIRRFRESDPPRMSKWFTSILLLFFAVIVIFRYTRWWPVILVGTFLLWGDVCLSYEERRRTLTDIGRGVIFDFLYMAGFSMLHRLYLSYRFIRFPMGFHTVTVTAVYLTAIVGTAAAFLIRKYWLLKKAGYRFGEIINGAWKEIVVFGMAISYLMMTMSRTGVLATFAVLFMLFLLFLFDRKEGKGILLRTAQMVGMMAMGFFIMILPVFSMQRMIPALVSSPMVFELEEEAMMVDVLRGDRYDSSYYICLERYAQVFKEKFFGASEADSDVLNVFDEILERRDAWNKENKMEVIEVPEIGEIMDRLDQGVPIEVIQEEQRVRKAIREERDIDPAVQQEMEARGITDFDEEDVVPEDTDEATEEKSDYTNGRRDIFRFYFQAIGLRGHEQMGYPLNENETIVHAHNTYLQSAYDHGVFGGILLLLLLFVAFLRAVMYYYKKKCDPETLSFLPVALTVGFAVTGLVEWVFHLCNPISLLFFMCIIPLSEKEQDG